MKKILQIKILYILFNYQLHQKTTTTNVVCLASKDDNCYLQLIFWTGIMIKKSRPQFYIACSNEGLPIHIYPYLNIFLQGRLDVILCLKCVYRMLLINCLLHNHVLHCPPVTSKAEMGFPNTCYRQTGSWLSVESLILLPL